jgi:hypothetical protein
MNPLGEPAINVLPVPRHRSLRAYDRGRQLKHVATATASTPTGPDSPRAPWPTELFLTMNLRSVASTGLRDGGCVPLVVQFATAALCLLLCALWSPGLGSGLRSACGRNAQDAVCGGLTP